MATLKLTTLRTRTSSLLRYPWMKIHGNIEAEPTDIVDATVFEVSMDENPWQLMPAATIAVIIVVILAVVHIF